MKCQQLRQMAIRQLENRCNRLLKLIKIGAPNAILCNEVRLIQKPIALMEEEFVDMRKREAMQEVAEAKNSIGLCCVQGCLNDYDSATDDDEWEEGSLMCEKHRDADDFPEEILSEATRD